MGQKSLENYSNVQNVNSLEICVSRVKAQKNRKRVRVSRRKLNHAFWQVLNCPEAEQGVEAAAATLAPQSHDRNRTVQSRLSPKGISVGALWSPLLAYIMKWLHG